MPLDERETTTEKFPGLTRAYPIRLVERHVEQPQQGQWYRVRACMFVGNPAFDCILKSSGGFKGLLYVDHTYRRHFATADEAIYLHVLERINLER